MTNTPFKRFLFRAIYEAGKKAGVSLVDALNAALVAHYSDVGKGRILTATTVGGHSVSFQIPQLGYHVMPSDIAETIEYLLTQVEETEAGTPAPANDDETFRTVLRELQPLQEFYTDHRFGRLQEAIQ